MLGFELLSDSIFGRGDHSQLGGVSERYFIQASWEVHFRTLTKDIPHAHSSH